MTKPPPQERPTAVRFLPETKEFLKQQAKENFRSLSSEIAARVERTRQEDIAKQGVPA